MTIAAVSIHQKGLQEIQTYFKETKSRSLDLTPPLKKGGVMMLRSIDQNFRNSGRPSPWRPLARSTLRWKLRHGYSPMPLTRTGDLRRSVTSRASGNKLLVGTSIPYASFHQFGTGRIPRREFLLFQELDIERINRLIMDHITAEGSDAG